MTDDTVAETLAELLSQQARRQGSAPAIIDPDGQSLSYGRLNEEVERLGAILADTGFGTASRIAVALPSGTDAAIAMLATMTRAVCAPLDPALERTACEWLLASMRADALLTPEGEEDAPAVAAARMLGLRLLRLRPTMANDSAALSLRAESASSRIVAEPPSANDLALLMHTSGTTAQPKIVPLTHRQLLSRGRLNPLVPTDRGICAAATFTSSAVESGLLATLVAGASVVLPSTFDPDRIIHYLQHVQPTYLWASPAVHAAVLEALTKRKLTVTTALRFLRSGSSALPAMLQEKLERAFGVPVMQGYGMTETGVIARNPLPPGQRRAGSAGKPLGTEVRITTSDGMLLPPGEAGEIVVKGPGVMGGYESAEANRRAFRDGWFRTGDVGYFDEDGFLFLTGRLDEVINRGGRQVSPGEVDAALLGHPAVLEAAAFAVPHPTLGEDLVAAVVPRGPEGVSVNELREFAFAHLAPFKVPTSIALVDALPKNALGKVQRSALADALRESLRASFLAPRDADEELVAGLFAEVLGLKRVGALDNFFELGGDSLSGAQVVMRVNLARGVDLHIASLFKLPTVAAFASALRGSTRPIPPIPVIPRQAGERRDETAI